jgi:hypothetical protein
VKIVLALEISTVACINVSTIREASHNGLGRRKVCEKYFLHCFTDEQKQVEAMICEDVIFAWLLPHSVTVNLHKSYMVAMVTCQLGDGRSCTLASHVVRTLKED